MAGKVGKPGTAGLGDHVWCCRNKCSGARKVHNRSGSPCERNNSALHHFSVTMGLITNTSLSTVFHKKHKKKKLAIIECCTTLFNLTETGTVRALKHGYIPLNLAISLTLLPLLRTL